MDRAEMIAYLLHQLPESQREALEDHWMENDDAHRQLQDTEAELLDAYSAGELSVEDRDRVEKYLLASPEQQRKLLFARMLREVQPIPQRRTFSMPGLAAAAAIVALAGAVAWLTVENHRERRELAEGKTLPVASVPVFVAEIPSDTMKRSTNSSSVEINPPSGAQILRLDLQLDPGDESQTFSVVLEREGREVWSEQPVHSERHDFGFAAPVWVPAAALVPGEYQVRLFADDRPINFYRFRVRPR